MEDCKCALFSLACSPKEGWDSTRHPHERGLNLALNPIVFTEKVVRSFLRYQLTSYPFADARLHQQMRRLLSLDETRQSPLLKGPFISLSRAFRTGASVTDLISQK